MTYDLWRSELVRLLSLQYSNEVIYQAIMPSIKGQAHKVVKNLGPDASIRHIISKFDSVYGTVYERDTVLAKFYSAIQDDKETASSWGCRLEYI